MEDRYNLQRFMDAQNSAYQKACSELSSGRKKGHWMWFIFPQIEGLGNSHLSREFAISSLDEAKAYLEHPVLGPRIRECCRLVNLVEERTSEQIFGYIDSLKFRSSMTLFSLATQDNEVFLASLKKYYGGNLDNLTLERLRNPE